jgi:hypothetical protein
MPPQTKAAPSGGIIKMIFVLSRLIDNVAASAAQCFVGLLSGGYASLHHRLCMMSPLARLRKNFNQERLCQIVLRKLFVQFQYFLYWY